MNTHRATKEEHDELSTSPSFINPLIDSEYVIPHWIRVCDLVTSKCQVFLCVLMTQWRMDQSETYLYGVYPLLEEGAESIDQ